MSDRVLIFGGTFDPPHRAHVELPALAAARLGCNRILYVPAAVNPLKAGHPPSPSEHRLAMLRLALRDVPQAEVWTGELDRAAMGGGPSYTIDTLRELAKEARPGTTFRLLIGADQALEFHRWKEWRRIVELAEPAVMLRPPWDRAAFELALRTSFDEAESAQWMQRIVLVPTMAISATEVRTRLRAREPLDDLLPAPVAAYIRRHGLYRNAP